MKTRFCTVMVDGKNGPEACFFGFETARLKMIVPSAAKVDPWEVRRSSGLWECRSTECFRPHLGHGSLFPQPLLTAKSSFQRFLREYPRFMVKSSVLLRS